MDICGVQVTQEFKNRYISIADVCLLKGPDKKIIHRYKELFLEGITDKLRIRVDFRYLIE